MVAKNGLVALSCLEADHFDLVVMDVQMPEMSGLDAAAAIREKEMKTGAHIPIVAITAHAMKGDRERCLAAGMDGYVPKPIHPEELFRVIDAVMSAPGSHTPVTTDLPAGAEPACETLLDRATLLGAVGGNAALLGKIVKLFLKSYPNAVSDLRNAGNQGDCASLARAAHTLRGGGGAFLTKAAIEILIRLESMGREEDLTDIDTNLTQLEREMALIEVELAALVAELAS